MKRIAVDMDEVLADALGKLIRLYNAEFSEDLTVEDMWGNWMVNVLPAEPPGPADGLSAGRRTSSKTST